MTDNNMRTDYRESLAGKRRFENKDLYLKTVEFQKYLQSQGIAWHNPFSDECTNDFECCCGGGDYKHYFPSSQVPKIDALNSELLKLRKFKEYVHDRLDKEQKLHDVLEDAVDRYGFAMNPNDEEYYRTLIQKPEPPKQ